MVSGDWINKDQILNDESGTTQERMGSAEIRMGTRKASLGRCSGFGHQLVTRRAGSSSSARRVMTRRAGSFSPPQRVIGERLQLVGTGADERVSIFRSVKINV